MNKAEKSIDIREVIRKKNPRLLAFLPPFVLSYLRRILHETELNAFLSEHGHQQGLDFAKAAIAHLQIKVEVTGLENIQTTGGVIYAANHPVGGIDGLSLMSVLGAHRNDLKFLANDIVANVQQLTPLFVPVNKHGRQHRESVLSLDQALQSEQAFVVFPAGLVSRKTNDGIQDLEWKKTFITQSRKYHLPVIPVFIGGKNRAFFYNLARLRTWLGIKANIEMFFLVDEMFAQQGKSISIRFGEPIPAQQFNNSCSDKAWAAFVRKKVYELAS